MAYKLISVKCPNCGQMLSLEENRTQAFCSYCGGKILISNENEYVVRKVDEAAIKQAEVDREVKLKELDIQQKLEGNSRALRIVLTVIWLIVSLALLAFLVLKISSDDGFVNGFLMLFYVGGPVIGGGAYLVFKVLPEKENERIITKRGGIRLPAELTPFAGKKYNAVEDTLRSAGFTNITCVNLHDCNVLTALVSNERIDKVTINGQVVMSGGRVYMPDVPIVITYHGK